MLMLRLRLTLTLMFHNFTSNNTNDGEYITNVNVLTTLMYIGLRPLLELGIA